MLFKTTKSSYLIAAMAIAALSSCSNDDDVAPLRTKIDYTTLTATKPYSSAFLDATNKTTVDLTNGNNRYKMFQTINSSIGASITANRVISATVLKNMFANTGSPFDSTKLNTSGVQLRNVVASSWPTTEAEAVRARFDLVFGEMAEASKSATLVAEKGKAGKLGTRLVDAKGIETVQIIQKSLIGALQYDYIANVLLTKGLDADNSKVVSGKTYSQLEQNWDEAYGLLTLNQVLHLGATDSQRGSTEFGLGSYLWEYNKTDYAKVYPAFLKGRAAIVNNDKTELKAQAAFIKAAFEKAIANSAVNYLAKANSGTDAEKAHALAEGLGFIYSLRFCNVNGGTAKFSDDILIALVGSANGYWDLTPAKTAAAADAIKAKFKL